MKTALLVWCSIFLLCFIVSVTSHNSSEETDTEVDVEITSDEEEGEDIQSTPPQDPIEEDFDPSIDPYPEHEPIMQPFELNYEEEQSAERKRMEEKAKRKSMQEEKDEKENEEVVLNSYPEIFESEFVKPEIQHDGMADHEPIYQPEDPGDNHVNYPFRNGEMEEEEKKDTQANLNTKKIIEKPLYEDTEDSEFDPDGDHEPVYQLEDPGELHDEL